MSETPDASTCSRPAASGASCNPTCQSGCECGWCGLDIDGKVKCLEGTPGTKTVPGTVCDPTNPNDCAPGLYCRAEQCGGGRCYKFCESDDDCSGTNTKCRVSQNGVQLCLLPDPSCDPVNVNQSGCPSGFACYPANPGTVCECPGSSGSGVSCLLTETCLPGYQCVTLTNMIKDATCQRLCRTSSDCGGGSTCVPGGDYGYCSP
ncbi:MAG TPA: hypothetical protein VMT03_20315 [Polyangia bacterium]|nr:hypothetical protein [Polyangia bacterium]